MSTQKIYVRGVSWNTISTNMLMFREQLRRDIAFKVSEPFSSIHFHGFAPVTPQGEEFRPDADRALISVVVAMPYAASLGIVKAAKYLNRLPEEAALLTDDLNKSMPLLSTSDVFNKSVTFTMPKAIKSRACEDNCSGRGTCDKGACRCFVTTDEWGTRGFAGERCYSPRCPKECNGNGFCEFDTSPDAPPAGGPNARAKCTCMRGWKGDDCSQKVCSIGGCSGHGTCRQSTDSCSCDNGWTGVDCANRACDGCNLEHGACVDGKCQCALGWGGDKCFNKLCDNDCNGNGQCDSTGKCHCYKNWFGASCAKTLCPSNCTLSGNWTAGMVTQDFEGTGQCREGGCFCLKGWRLPSCTERSCGSFGIDKKEEDGSHYCVCLQGYTGNLCQIPPSGQPVPDVDIGTRAVVTPDLAPSSAGAQPSENFVTPPAWQQGNQTASNDSAIQWGDKPVGAACMDHTDCASRSCDQWGIYGCEWKCTIETPSAKKGANINCPK